MTALAQLRPELIQIAPPWRTFSQTIAGLVASLVAADAVPAAGETAAFQAVVAREAEGSTALLDIRAGVPHARLAGIRQPVMALAVSRDGLYEAVPTVPIQIVALVLSPLNANTEHLSTLAAIATLLRSAELRGALLAARDGSEAVAALRRHDRAMP
jgi:mannitol/fructose-specific phosphotransferase system IIA component (Ntr-type)